MKRIPPPCKAGLYADRDIDCQQAIERAYQELMERITESGWGPAEATEALEQLALADRWTRANKSAIAGYRLLDDLVAARQDHG